MHELSIAMSLVDVATEELERQGGDRVVVIHLKVGPLSGVIKQALSSAFELASENSVCADARLNFEDEPVEIECVPCGGPRPVRSIQEMRCAQCGTPSANVIRGRALEVIAMEICDEQPTPDGRSSPEDSQAERCDRPRAEAAI
jgi:hydrogenase nickel incorporation protein HypA/HybF